MRTRGTGSVSRHPKDRALPLIYWVAQATIAGKRRSFYGQTEREVVAKLKAATSERAITGGRLTVAAFLNDWLEDERRRVTRKQVELSTYANSERMLRNHVTPAIGRMQLRELRPEDVNVMLSKIIGVNGAPLSPRTRAVVRTILGHALFDAEGRGLVAVNAARHSERVRQEHQEAEPFTMIEAQKIVAAAEDHDAGATFLTALLLGMRQGEVLGLLWRNVDLDAGLLKVRTHLKREDGQFVLGDLKTHQRSRRDLWLPERLVAVLRRHQARQDATASGAGALGLVFTTSTGTPIEKTNFIRRQWRPFLRGAGVAYRPFHTTRHTAASVAFAAGVPISEISKTLGHTSVRTTQDIYQHQFSKIRSAAPGAVADALFTSRPTSPAATEDPQEIP
jgi:integrase